MGFDNWMQPMRYKYTQQRDDYEIKVDARKSQKFEILFKTQWKGYSNNVKSGSEQWISWFVVLADFDQILLRFGLKVAQGTFTLNFDWSTQL